jgi:hypothetical protein
MILPTISLQFVIGIISGYRFHNAPYMNKTQGILYPGTALLRRIEEDLPRSRISQIEPKVRSKRRKGKRRRTPNFQEKMVKQFKFWVIWMKTSSTFSTLRLKNSVGQE